MLERLFTSKGRVKILQFLLFNNTPLHLRGLSNELNMPVSAVKREIDNLVHTGLVKKQRNELTINEECNITADLRNIFIKTDAFALVLNRINKPNVKYAFVFGSFAGETYNPDSDIDLFIVGDISNSDVVKLIKPVENQLGREISPVVWPLKDLKTKSKKPFIKQIAKRNIIMIKGNENELRKIIGTG